MKIESVLRRYGSFLLHKESLSSVRAILLESLENLPVERQFAEYKLAELGWSYSDEYLLIRLQPEFRHEWQMHAAYLIPYIEQLWPGACAVEKGDYIVILVNQTQYHSKSAKVLTQELAYFLRDGPASRRAQPSVPGTGQHPGLLQAGGAVRLPGPGKKTRCTGITDLTISPWIAGFVTAQ